MYSNDTNEIFRNGRFLISAAQVVFPPFLIPGLHVSIQSLQQVALFYRVALTATWCVFCLFNFFFNCLSSSIAPRVWSTRHCTWSLFLFIIKTLVWDCALPQFVICIQVALGACLRPIDGAITYFLLPLMLRCVYIGSWVKWWMG